MTAVLRRGEDRSAAVEALVGHAGGRVGLAGVLRDLGRTAVARSRRGCDRCFTWDDADRRDARWWPQGVTGSWDVAPGVGPPPHDVLITTAYAKPRDGVRLGARLTVHDVSDPRSVRYEHVLLVDAQVEDGSLRLRPVHAHAGGVAWVGRHLHVAATATGFHSFDPADIVRAECGSHLGLPDHGHRYLLPVRTTYHSTTAKGHPPPRFSFLSAVQETHASVPTTRLLAGEYGRGAMTTRLWTYDLDPTTGLPVTREDGTARPAYLRTPGVARMQGAVLVAGRLHVTTSSGRFRRGSMWAEHGGRLVQLPATLPPGPEDASHDPVHDRLWTVTEYPYRRAVLAFPRDRVVPAPSRP